ncbi:MAG: glycosyl hydrolase family 28 protein [Bacteroidales bacterium]|jgi:polygalacturonase/lysophospholipase L1-like esterase|nr:glycosyl hydrolase family 28 protein [Bacteroidales bacterium]
MRLNRFLIMVILTAFFSAFTTSQPAEYPKAEGKKKITRIWLIGDSTVADYSLEKDYKSKRYPIMGWGQVFQSFMASDSLRLIRHLVRSDSALVDDRARGGRSTRSFFEEGLWADVYHRLRPGDIVFIQFGHNDASVNKGERYTSLPGYREFLRLYVSQSRGKGAIPILVTPVARNYPWKDGMLGNTHGDYPTAMQEVAEETGTYLIDLNTLSREYFSRKGRDYVSMTYFMNLPPGLYEAYPDGISDNTHFQPAGATALAQLVFSAMKELKPGKPGTSASAPSAGRTTGTLHPATGSSDVLPAATGSGAALSLSGSRPARSSPAGEIYRDVEFDMPQVIEPQIPYNTVSINDFGAVGDGIVLNTEAFRKAIETVSSRGGGTVVIPRGIWLTGPIILKSNIRMHAEEGALILFSPDKSLYPLIETSFEGYNTVRCLSPVYGKDLENIAFTGKGVWDGSGHFWRHVKKEKVPPPMWSDLVRSGGVVSQDGKTWYPSESYGKAIDQSEMNVPMSLEGGIESYEWMRDFLRPVMVSLVNCKKVMLDGPVFQNSPAWCLHPLMCENLTVRNVTVRNPWYSQNGDGIDIESCLNTVLYNCNFDVGDDAICIKSGKNEDGRKRGIPTENLVIRNCIVYHGHGGVTIGSEMSGGVRNVSVAGCTFMGTDVGIRFKSNRGRGGVVENIWFNEILMTDIPTQAISFNLYYGGLSVSEMLAEGKNVETTLGDIPPVTEETPLFRNIFMKNITCRGAGQAIYLQGLPELNLENVIMENIDMTAGNGMACIDATGITVRNMRLITENKPVLFFLNSTGVEITGLQIPDTVNGFFEVRGTGSADITVETVTPDGTASVRKIR